MDLGSMRQEAICYSICASAICLAAWTHYKNHNQRQKNLMIFRTAQYFQSRYIDHCQEQIRIEHRAHAGLTTNDDSRRPLSQVQELSCEDRMQTRQRTDSLFSASKKSEKYGSASKAMRNMLRDSLGVGRLSRKSQSPDNSSFNKIRASPNFKDNYSRKSRANSEQSQTLSPLRLDKWRPMLLKEIEQTKSPISKTELEKICSKINLVIVDENGDDMSASTAKKPTDLDLRALKKKYISKESIVNILNSAWTFNGAKELNDLYKQKRFEAIEDQNIKMYEELVKIFDHELNATRLYNNTCMILDLFGLSYDDLHASQEQLFPVQDELAMQLQASELMNQQIPEWLNDERAKEIEQEIRTLTENIRQQEEERRHIDLDLSDPQTKYIKLWALEIVLKKFNLTEDQLKKALYACVYTESSLQSSYYRNEETQSAASMPVPSVAQRQNNSPPLKYQSPQVKNQGSDSQSMIEVANRDDLLEPFVSPNTKQQSANTKQESKNVK